MLHSSYLLILALFLAGCTEKADIPPKGEPSPVPDASAPAPTDAPAPPLASTAETKAAVAATLASPEYADLNRLVEFYYDEHKRVPTIVELTRSFGRPLPPPPPGHIFHIDPRTKTVKVVPVR